MSQRIVDRKKGRWRIANGDFYISVDETTTKMGGEGERRREAERKMEFHEVEYERGRRTPAVDLSSAF